MDATELAAQTVLTHQQAQAVLLKADGLEPPEIAGEMGITRQAVHSHLGRAADKAEQAEATVDRLEDIGFI